MESILLRFCCFILFATAGVAANAYDFAVNGIYYNILSKTDRTVEVTKSDGNDYSGDVVIPAVVDHGGVTYSVTKIGEGAFSLCPALISVSMSSVDTIDYGAFSHSGNLASVSLPATLTSIKGNPFLSCSALKEIVVDEDNTKYSSDGGVLYDKSKETLICWPTVQADIDIPSSVKTIGESAFGNCHNLTSVSMPSVETIGGMAFICCSSLTSVSMPSVKMIDYLAFHICTDLTSVSMPSVETIGENAFSCCFILTSVDMPSVKTIGNEAFEGCALMSASLPASCTLVGVNPFSACSELEEIVVDENNMNYTSVDGVLYDKAIRTLICCPAGKHSIDMPSSVTKIGEKAIFDCDRLTSVRLPASCASIVGNPFGSCNSLEELVVDGDNLNFASIDGVLYDKDIRTLMVFPGARHSVDVPPSVTTIGRSAFFSCDSLRSVSMPSVTTLGNAAFYGCGNLALAEMPKVTMVGDSAFLFCRNLKSVSMPSAVTIGEDAFECLDSLVSVDIPASVTSIGSHAFYFSDSLTSVHCHWERPLECGQLFDDEVLENATLFVPVGTMEAYRAVAPWSRFANIKEKD